MNNCSGASAVAETCSREPSRAASALTGFDQARDELEPVVHDIWRDARLLATAPDTALAIHKTNLIEARECLNDAIAKAERVKEAA